MSAWAELVEVMDRLRRECPWTAQQTHASLAHFLLEEAHETLEALEGAAGAEHLREELGDLLMQVVFHARIASEAVDGFDIDDVVRGITAKLVRRNPHVFAGGTASTPEEIDAAWQAVKATEKRRDSVHDGIPPTLPALAHADAVLRRLGDPPVRVPEESTDIGEQLLALVAQARAQGIDAEQALRQHVRNLPSVAH